VLPTSLNVSEGALEVVQSINLKRHHALFPVPPGAINISVMANGARSTNGVPRDPSD
jgi:hypothetical protein